MLFPRAPTPGNWNRRMRRRSTACAKKLVDSGNNTMQRHRSGSNGKKLGPREKNAGNAWRLTGQHVQNISFPVVFQNELITFGTRASVHFRDGSKIQGDLDMICGWISRKRFEPLIPAKASRSCNAANDFDTQQQDILDLQG